jgi:TatD DNase family protein
LSENWPPLDLHAHIDPSIEPSELIALRAVVFAATRCLAEFNQTRSRRDPITVWGVGAHPAVPEALQHFSAIDLQSAIRSTPLISEVGMDANSPASRAQQRRVLGEILDVTEDEPRIVSIHSAGAASWVLDALADHPQKGVVLHWWRGKPDETARAVMLGCFFSINESELRRPTVIGRVPWDRLLPETDHPYGDRQGDAAPGNVEAVEQAIAGKLGVSASSVRRGLWGNLARLVEATGTASLFGDRIQRMLSMAPESLSSSAGAPSP